MEKLLPGCLPDTGQPHQGISLTNEDICPVMNGSFR